MTDTNVFTDWFYNNEQLIEDTLLSTENDDLVILSLKESNDTVSYKFHIGEDAELFDTNNDDYEFNIELPTSEVSHEEHLNSWKYAILSEILYSEKEPIPPKKSLTPSSSGKDYVTLLKNLAEIGIAKGITNDTLINELRKDDDQWSWLAEKDFLNDDYVQSYEKQIEKALKVTAFAEKLPMHEYMIYTHRLTGEEPYIQFNYLNKTHVFCSSTDRVLYSMDQEAEAVQQLPDYEKEYSDIHLNLITVNPQYVFGVNNKFNLDDIQTTIVVFHTIEKAWETTYFVTDEQLKDLYVALDTWVENNRPHADAILKSNRIIEIKELIKELNDELTQLENDL